MRKGKEWNEMRQGEGEGEGGRGEGETLILYSSETITNRKRHDDHIYRKQRSFAKHTFTGIVPSRFKSYLIILVLA